MKSLAVRALLAACGLVSLYSISSGSARADDWGCQVILCLSNPGGPTQYAECVPPIHKLWRELARGHAFPTCSGAGFRTSRPGYEPYYCDTGYNLTTRYGDHGREAACVSTSPQIVDSRQCGSRDAGSAVSARWQRSEGHLACEAYVTMRPNVRSRPHYIDITIDGAGRQRVWF